MVKLDFPFPPKLFSPDPEFPLPSDDTTICDEFLLAQLTSDPLLDFDNVDIDKYIPPFAETPASPDLLSCWFDGPHVQGSYKKVEHLHAC